MTVGLQIFMVLSVSNNRTVSEPIESLKFDTMIYYSIMSKKGKFEDTGFFTN